MSQPQAAPLLEIDNLSATFHTVQGEVRVLNNVSFTIHAGETVGLVGESGSGKSVLAHSIMGLYSPQLISYPSGTMRFQGVNLLELQENQKQKLRGNRLSMVFQEPMTALNPLHSIGRQIGEALELHQVLLPVQVLEETKRLLHMVGFEEGVKRLDSYPHELSGGQRQRVMIAMALANKPDILIADEPTTALDVTVQAQIVELLMTLQSKLKMALLMITHDLDIVRHMAARTVVLRQGKVVEEGTTTKLFSHPNHPYTKTLISAEPQGRPAPVSSRAPVVLEAQNVSVFFGSKRLWAFSANAVKNAVKNVSLVIKQGETIGLVGESGSGKTTLALALLRLHKAEGVIVFLGQRLDRLRSSQLRSYRQKMQIVFQDPFGSLNPRLTVDMIVGEGLKVHEPQLSRQALTDRVVDALEKVRLSAAILKRYPHEFSGGQRQRLALARALILSPQLLILDEPTSALDRAIQLEMVELLRSLQEKQKFSCLFITHDLKVVRAVSHRLLIMKEGEVCEEGQTEEIFRCPQHGYTKTLLQAAYL